MVLTLLPELSVSMLLSNFTVSVLSKEKASNTGQHLTMSCVVYYNKLSNKVYVQVRRCMKSSPFVWYWTWSPNQTIMLSDFSWLSWWSVWISPETHPYFPVFLDVNKPTEATAVGGDCIYCSWSTLHRCQRSSFTSKNCTTEQGLQSEHTFRSALMVIFWSVCSFFNQ